MFKQRLAQTQPLRVGFNKTEALKTQYFLVKTATQQDSPEGVAMTSLNMRVLSSGQLRAVELPSSISGLMTWHMASAFSCTAGLTVTLITSLPTTLRADL